MSDEVLSQSFKSAVDWWYYAVLILVPLSLLSQIPSFSDPDELRWLLAVGLLATALPVWLLLSTRYIVSAELLLVKSGPFRWRIPRAEIHSVETSRSVLSSPALSLDRLRIDYGAGKFVLVSPAQRNAFIEALAVNREN